MRLMHIGDLHLGKRVYEFSMAEDQERILGEILRIAERERPDAVLIAGDVYDKAVPPTEAVTLFDDFLFSLNRLGMPTFVTVGNHDSAERLSFGGRLMEGSGVYIAPAYRGEVPVYPLTDCHGDVNVYMLPFVKPAHVRAAYPDEEISSYTDAVRVALSKAGVDPAARNVLVAHQFVTGADPSGSEDIAVGGMDNVDASVFSAFDYVALGHIHGSQDVSSDVGTTVRYCGSPLKYSFSEAWKGKSVTIVEMREKGDVSLREVPLEPYRDMQEIRGAFDEVMDAAYAARAGVNPESYMRVTLTDEESVPDAVEKLRTRYRFLMRLDYDNTRTRASDTEPDVDVTDGRSPLDVFADFFEQRNGSPMTEEQRSYMEKLCEEIWRDDE